MWAFSTQPSELARIEDPNEIEALTQQARQRRARERLENIADMRTAMARTDDEWQAVQPGLVELAQVASGGDEKVLGQILLEVM